MTDISNVFQRTFNDSSILHNMLNATKLFSFFVNLTILLCHSKIVVDFLELVWKKVTELTAP